MVNAEMGALSGVWLRGVGVMFEALYTDLVQTFPSAAALVEWLRGFIAFKDIILVGGMFIIVLLLRRERRKISGLIVDLGQRVDTMSQLAKAARADFETAMARPVAGGQVQSLGSSNWEVVQSIWRETRDRIELVIEQISDKRVKPKYAKILRYNYSDVIITLRDDEIIPSGKAFTALISMNGLFQRLKLRPANVTSKEVEQFKFLLKDVNGSLPKLPRAKSSDPTPPSSLPIAAE